MPHGGVSGSRDRGHVPTSPSKTKTQVVARELPEAVRTFEPESPVTVDRKIFLKCLKSAPRGASPGPGGCTYEHLKTLLDDTDTMELLFLAITSLARANVPVEIAEVLMGARLTALTEPDGRVRGIATGSSLRRLVARILARHFMGALKKECAPFQYALSTRAGTDQVAEMVVHAMNGEQPTGCLGELQEVSRRLDREGFWWRPSWPELLHGKRPPQNTTGEPGVWQHGWQYHFRRVLQEDPDAVSPSSQLSRTSSVPLQTQRWSSSLAPTAPEYVIPPHLIRTMLLERLQSSVSAHRQAAETCNPLFIERDLARVCQKAGARVRFNAFLRDMNIGVGANDGRRIQVLAQDLPCFG